MPWRCCAIAVGLVLQLGTGCVGEELEVALPPEQTDRFTSAPQPRLDVLWVVDNSSSMAAEQQKLANEASHFLAALVARNVDYHLGVLTTDPTEDGVLRALPGEPVAGCDGCRYLTPSVPCADPDASDPTRCTALAAFRRLVLVGTPGTAWQTAFEHVAEALALSSAGERVEPPQPNVGFLRDAADLLIVFVSDENEGLDSAAAPVHYFERLYSQLKAGTQNNVSVSSVVGWPLESQTGRPQVMAESLCEVLATQLDRDPESAHPNLEQVQATMEDNAGCFDMNADGTLQDGFAAQGHRYIELACRMGGVVGNICSEGYGEVVSRLALSALSLAQTYPLARATEVDRGPDCNLFTDDDERLDCDGNGSTEDAIDGPICVRATPVNADQAEPIERHATDGWQWNDKKGAVVFGGDLVPAPGTEVAVRYKLYRGTAPCL